MLRSGEALIVNGVFGDETNMATLRKQSDRIERGARARWSSFESVDGQGDLRGYM